ncbi:hypothetical protein [Coraliomargarita parva]|uniref:hypothetical protein n=1 Tax=Coraliomargarita parva TaxID=3014050 RepID=UPI0022B473E4|nr:hypothetical protein [Coraliomargarita parva]
MLEFLLFLLIVAILGGVSGLIIKGVQSLATFLRIGILPGGILLLLGGILMMVFGGDEIWLQFIGFFLTLAGYILIINRLIRAIRVKRGLPACPEGPQTLKQQLQSGLLAVLIVFLTVFGAGFLIALLQ